MLTEKGSSVLIGSPVMLLPRSVSHHRPAVRDDQPSQYDTNGWFSTENQSLSLCSLAVISLRITWAYLAQSPQFYKQIMVGVFERVYEIGPVFRAEPHDTSRHVNEYVSLDTEFGFIQNHFTVMAVLRDVIA